MSGSNSPSPLHPRFLHCWSHLRRRFVKLVRNTKSPIAEAAIRQIAALYLLAKGSENRIEPVVPAEATRSLLANLLFFAEDQELVQQVFHSAFEFVKRVPVSRLTFVPDARVWELIG